MPGIREPQSKSCPQNSLQEKKLQQNHSPKRLKPESQMILSQCAMQIKLVKVWDLK